MNTLERLVYRVPDVARLLGCTEAAVRRMIESGAIPSRRLGRRVVVLPEELGAYLKSLHRHGQELGDDDPQLCPKTINKEARDDECQGTR